MYLVTHPDYLDRKINVVLYNLSKETTQVILPMLFDKLPDESVIALADNIDWAKKFKNAFWFTENQKLDIENQFIIDGVDTIAESCAILFAKINNIT